MKCHRFLEFLELSSLCFAPRTLMGFRCLMGRCCRTYVNSPSTGTLASPSAYWHPCIPLSQYSSTSTTYWTGPSPNDSSMVRVRCTPERSGNSTEVRALDCVVSRVLFSLFHLSSFASAILQWYRMRVSLLVCVFSLRYSSAPEFCDHGFYYAS